jgi:hypothetical protein
LGQFAYVTNSVSRDISAYILDANTGVLTEVPGSPFSAGENPMSITVIRVAGAP